jgi:hypothetical protein
MTHHLKSLLLASALATALGTVGFAQSASTVGSAGKSSGPAGTSATGGSAGSAAVGGTSASTIGSGGTSTSPTGTTSSSIGSGGSAAGGIKNTSRTKIGGNQNNLHSMSRARAQDGGTWSRSSTRTKVHKGEVVSRTKSMAHEPGGAPVKSTTTVGTD